MLRLALMAMACLGSLEERVGQLLIVHFQGEHINDDAKRLMDQAHVGGFCYYDLCNGEDVSPLSEELQSYSKHPLIIAIDQEGGRVQRLKKGFTSIPSASEMDNPYRWGRCVGKELKECGINLNLAPVADLQMGSRSFSDDPEVVIQKARAFIQGMREEGVMACLKHYPGHGDAVVDPHDGLPTASFDERNLRPFDELAKEVPFVMTAHIRIPEIDEVPATVSAKWLQRLDFNGLVMTDSLTMGGILQHCGSLNEAACQALEAGCHLLLIGRKSLSGGCGESENLTEDILNLHAYLVQCVRDGLIDEALIDEKLQKRYACLNEKS